MTATDYTPRGRPFTGQKMLATVLGFFAVIIAANLTMAWFAVTGFRGVVVESGYVASQDFNVATARLAEQTARGWRLDLTAEAGHPALRLTDAAGAPLVGLAIAAIAERPGDQRLDQVLHMTETAPGLYWAAESLTPGAWQLALVATGIGPRYALTRDLFVNPGN